MRILAARGASTAHPLAWLAALTAVLLACGGRTEVAEEPAQDPVPLSGIYDVKGVTKPIGGVGDERKIAGTLILRTDGERYDASFKLDTTFPGAEQDVQADVIGTGEGLIEGRTLTGTTKTQLIVSTVPGIDTDFAFIPRMVGARIVSTAVTKVSPEGRVLIELENRPAEGDEYLPTKTRLTGLRVADAGDRGLPQVSSNTD